MGCICRRPFIPERAVLGGYATKTSFQRRLTPARLRALSGVQIAKQLTDWGANVVIAGRAKPLVWVCTV
jgi:hypothetical protein